MDVEILIPIAFFISTVVLVVFLRKFTNDERMAMIEKGLDVKALSYSNEFTPLRFGLLFIGAGVGLLLASIIDALVPALNDEATYFSLIFIFSGLGLYLSYQSEQKKRDKTGKDA